MDDASTQVGLLQKLNSVVLWAEMALSLKRYAWRYYDSNKRLNRILKESRNENERKMSIAMDPNIGDRLPNGLIIEILSWLPVKTLLQFRCVCKSWYAIIASPMFISKHLENYYTNSDSDCFLAQCCVLTHTGELELKELLVDETPKVLAYATLNDVPEHNARIYGPCHGIFYMYFYNDDHDDRALWNPVTNELRFLPQLTIKSNPPSDDVKYAWWDMVYDFGLDPATKDYKVIVIQEYLSEAHPAEESRYPLSAFVYSLRTNSWRQMCVLKQYYYLKQNKCYVCRNGVFYWLGSYKYHGDSQVIISFDMATDLFHEIKLPDYDKPASNSLAMYHDSIAFCTVKEEILNIWTLNEQSCWTKILAIGPLVGLHKPLGHWKNDKIVLEFGHHSYGRVLWLCDPSTQEIWDLGFREKNGYRGFFLYKESLVSFKDRSGWLQYDEAKALANSRKLKKRLRCSGLRSTEWYEYE